MKKQHGGARLGSGAKKTGAQVVSFSAPPDCLALLEQLRASGQFGKTRGSVICAALKALKAQGDS